MGRNWKVFIFIFSLSLAQYEVTVMVLHKILPRRLADLMFCLIDMSLLCVLSFEIHHVCVPKMVWDGLPDSISNCYEIGLGM